MIDLWIDQALHEQKIVCDKMNDSDVRSIVESIRTRFTAGCTGSFLWEHFHGDVSVCIEDTAEQAVAIVSTPVLLLYLDDMRYSGLVFTEKDDLARFVRNMPRFEFYLTNHSADYVACPNHHDYLIGVGTIVNVVKALARERDQLATQDM